MLRFILLVTSIFVSSSSYAQLSGTVLNKKDGSAVSQSGIYLNNKQIAVSNESGKFTLDATVFPIRLVTKKEGFETDTLLVKQPGEVTIYLLPSEVREMNAVVVSAGKRAQKVEEVSISMEIIKPELINNKGITDLEQAVNQSPGVFAMDGQVSIRGGGGYSYGAGSRVLLAWNGIPMVSPDVGDIKWNSVPMENASQIEVIKGASSVLYGSGALNGIISMNEKDPLRKGELFVKVQSGLYGNPKRESLKWWSKNPLFHTADVFYGKMFKQVGFTLSANGFTSEGYRQGEVEERARFGGSFVFRPQKLSNLKIGVFYNAQYQYTGNFILWHSDSLGYVAQGDSLGAIQPSSTITKQASIRVNVDPYIKFTDKHKNKHELKTRYYLVSTGNESQVYASAKAEMYFANYQFQKQWNNRSNLSAGATSTDNIIISPVFGDHVSRNYALYGQFEQKWKSLDFTFGTRLEYFDMDGQQGDSRFILGKDSSVILPIYPIFRAGLHYAATKSTHLRASYGQGIRFPSVAERYAATSNGGVIIFPNPDLQPEKGWAAEIGIKQIVRLGEWKGMIDIAGFINQYDNMIEYTFGVYNPDTIVLTPDNLTNWVGFKAKNAERARITGVEISFNSSGKIGPIEVVTLLGYTYMKPVSLNNDPNYVLMSSDTTTNMLKYRFNHLAKADVELNYKKYSLGFSMRYNSFMRNIDRVFLEDLNPTADELFVLPGLSDYRQRFNGGNLVFDARIGYTLLDKIKLNFIVNNLFNTEYTSRPADIQAPRTFMLQLQFRL